MHPTVHYIPAAQQQQSQTTQWYYPPSFYNGYMTATPIVLNQSMPIAQTYLPSIVQQNQKVSQSSRIISPLYTSSMRSYDNFRNAVSCSDQRQANTSDEEFFYHEQQLNRNLAKHGIERISVKGDGNCLFYALADGLMYEMKTDPHGFGLVLQQAFRLSTRTRLIDFADRLRQICIEKWRSHEDYYSQFVDQEKVAFLKEVKKFSKSGVSDSTLGDIVPLTVANAFNVNIIIFTSVLDLPRIDVKPARKSSLPPVSRKTIYLAYNQYGIGHYDAAYPRT